VEPDGAGGKGRTSCATAAVADNAVHTTLTRERKARYRETLRESIVLFPFSHEHISAKRAALVATDQ
jgi:hypothetical protein